MKFDMRFKNIKIKEHAIQQLRPRLVTVFKQ